MQQLCIYARPEIQSLGQIQELRKRFDPMVDNIEPHITLVFPFWTDQEVSEIRKHVREVLAGKSEINFQLGAPETAEGFATFPVKCADKELTYLFDELNSELLAPFRLSVPEFKPHITFGRYDSEFKAEHMRSTAAQLINPSDGQIKKVLLEEISDDGSAVIVESWSLQPTKEKA